MSAMAKMLADMLLKELPTEIREAVTPENLQRITQAITERFRRYDDALQTLVTRQDEQGETLSEILELLKNDNRSSQRTGKPKRDVRAITGNGSGEPS